ncbi:hypothetical protein [Archaeoglobus veneficus]|uniref:Uncharacterized protein n=1 Tax=Archaeoglobus veneficus (strain DSM 11195 / SNP6) TaxID=693661 RepID=F2KRF0_ARCVS|nr:hypothetical protein [Archaeoglobus veneficus]AEA47884.1 hypothetical protein Arcve_1891 [Archaeoglobus veneficus SNP6]
MRVYTSVPNGWKDLIEDAKEIEGWEETSDYLRELIKKDLVSKGLLGVKNGEMEEKEAVLVEG